ncbi:ABC transporter ATP-binding protein, partial [Psychrobacter sp. 1U2]
ANKASENTKSTNKSAAENKPKKTAKKLNFNEQRELDNLPKQIATLEQEQTQLQEKLADGSWFTEDFDAATVASERLLVIEDEMMNMLERWEALENN